MIDPVLFEKCFNAARSRPGMGDFKVAFDPYRCEWFAQISFCVKDAEYYKGYDFDINTAMSLCFAEFTKAHTNNPKLGYEI